MPFGIQLLLTVTAWTSIPMPETLIWFATQSAERCCANLNAHAHRNMIHGEITFTHEQSGNRLRYFAHFNLTGERRLLDADATLAAHKGAI